MTTERARVLVVEDRPSVLKLMSVILASAYEVTTVGDGVRALAIAGAGPPVDVILTDIRLPGPSGFDLLRAVRERGLPTAVVMMTGYPSVPDAVAAIKLGAFDYLTKPIEAEEIALVVARAVAYVRAGGVAQDVAPELADGEDVAKGYRRVVEEARDRASRGYLVQLMRLCRGHVTAAATRAGMTRESLHRLLKQYGVHSTEYKATEGSEPELGDEPRALEG
jgi:DNA-binding NtrC family response regulator